jgi:hypothetical protein
MPAINRPTGDPLAHRARWAGSNAAFGPAQTERWCNAVDRNGRDDPIWRNGTEFEWQTTEAEPS